MTPHNDVDKRRDRAIGSLIGLAAGDALGTTLEFSLRDSGPRVTGMVGGGPFDLAPGEWTDDTSMALCLAESILARGAIDPEDLMRRFTAWRQDGDNSVTGVCFDVGITTSAALQRFLDTGNPLSGGADPRTAGNGSLMRLAPAAIRWCGEPAKAREAARLQSRTTHGAPQAVDACGFFAGLLVEAIAGEPKESLLSPRAFEGHEAIAKIAAGSWRGKRRDEISSSGYVAHTLEAALWAAAGAESFEDALIAAVNLGGDADTAGAVTGQLAGALWGASRIPAAWLEKLAWRERIERLAASLFEAGAAD